MRNVVAKLAIAAALLAAAGCVSAPVARAPAPAEAPTPGTASLVIHAGAKGAVTVCATEGRFATTYDGRAEQGQPVTRRVPAGQRLVLQGRALDIKKERNYAHQGGAQPSQTVDLNGQAVSGKQCRAETSFTAEAGRFYEAVFVTDVEACRFEVWRLADDGSDVKRTPVEVGPAPAAPCK